MYSYSCELHNMPGCSTCFRAEGECDWGSCQSKATARLGAFTKYGALRETRGTCKKHLDYMKQTTKSEICPIVEVI